MNEIVVCEMWCRGFEHVEFNAAFLRTVNLAFPDARLLFLSEAAHGDMVRRRLQDAASCSVAYGRIPVPRRDVPSLRMFLTELLSCWDALSLVRRRSSSALIFSCLKGSSLLAVNALMRFRAINGPTVGVVHGELSSLLTKPQRRPWNRALSFHSTLRWRISNRLRLVVLGDPIKREVVELLPNSRHLWRSIELVGFLPGDGSANSRSLAPERPMRLGFLGASSKGFAGFCHVAQAIKNESSGLVEFEMVGFLGNGKGSKGVEQFVTGISDKPLAPNEYRKRLNGLDYCLGLDSTEHHRLAGSGTFVDALAYGKPYIALRNPYLTYYFDLFGDIGYLCDSVEQMCDCVRGIIADPPRERYAQQVDNIVRGREIFAPESVAPKLRQIISEMTALGS